nr:MAG TPA: hypothetical protein [Caudoviricetes sp.]
MRYCSACFEHGLFNPLNPYSTSSTAAFSSSKVL